MASTVVDNVDDIPQWKKDLIARRHNQHKRTATAVERQQLCNGPPRLVDAVGHASSVQQPGAKELVVVLRYERCASVPNSASVNIAGMVQDRPWTYDPSQGVEKNDSDSSEDLHYGPGIVSRLKNKYLSLALRESTRASILPMRKAASLENILDDVPITAPGNDHLFQQNGNNNINRNSKNRYRAATRGLSDMKRARSVETISRVDDHHHHHHNDLIEAKKRESLHEEVLITYSGNDKLPKTATNDNNMVETAPEMKPYNQWINRPKRLMPIMNEKEKPPADFVKQTKRIFERRPEERTKPPQHTGEVAAKVATYTTIIGQTKYAKKPPIKNPKPNMRHPIKRGNGVKSNKMKKEPQKSLASPIPDISMIDTHGDNESTHQTSLSETPDLIMTSSPLAMMSPTYRIAATEDFIKEEILHSSKLVNGVKSPIKSHTKDDSTPAQSVTFNFAKNPPNIHRHPPAIPPLLKLEINGINHDGDGVVEVVCAVRSPVVVEVQKSPVKTPKSPSPVATPSSTTPFTVNTCEPDKPNLTSVEIKKNFINAVKTREIPSNDCAKVDSNGVKKDVSVEIDNVVPKLKSVSHNDAVSNSSSPIMRFNFTDRKEIPDYVHNDGTIRVQPVQKPKAGEGGIIIIPGASLDESAIDGDDEWLNSLEAPPSPCDVMFVNDNILIDGKSSLNQKTKKARMKISFVDSHPEIYEYPSESSLLFDESFSSPTKGAHMGHAVASLTGSSSLANYTPKSTITTDEFEPGVTRIIAPPPIDNKSDDHNDSPLDNGLVLEDADEPILFSSGTNSDMLF